MNGETDLERDCFAQIMYEGLSCDLILLIGKPVGLLICLRLQPLPNNTVVLTPSCLLFSVTRPTFQRRWTSQQHLQEQQL